MPFPIIASHTRLDNFAAAVITCARSGPVFNPHSYLLYLDPFSSTAFIKFFPFSHRFEAKGMRMIHFDKLLHVFNAVRGGVQITELCLTDCTLCGQVFFWIVNDNMHRIHITNVHVFGGKDSEHPIPSSSPQTPAFWEDILPIFLHQARLTSCHLEDLKDYTTSNTSEPSHRVILHAHGLKEIQQSMKALYWDLVFRTWCGDPVEASQTETFHRSRGLPNSQSPAKMPATEVTPKMSIDRFSDPPQ